VTGAAMDGTGGKLLVWFSGAAVGLAAGLAVAVAATTHRGWAAWDGWHDAMLTATVKGRRAVAVCRSPGGDLTECVFDNVASLSATTGAAFVEGEPIVLETEVVAKGRGLPAGITIRGFLKALPSTDRSLYLRPVLACDAAGEALPAEFDRVLGGNGDDRGVVLSTVLGLDADGRLFQVAAEADTTQSFDMSVTGLPVPDARCAEDAGAWLARQPLPELGGGAADGADGEPPDDEGPDDDAPFRPDPSAPRVISL